MRVDGRAIFAGLLLIALMGRQSVSAQTYRYYEFKVDECGHGNWQDTLFIAATSDTVVIDSVEANLAKPYNNRRFISGEIAHGDGGYNKNASHTFLWHFVPDKWQLVVIAIEACDGCPFSDVDADTAYWISTLQLYCPNGSKPVRDVTHLVSVRHLTMADKFSVLYDQSENMIRLQSESATQEAYSMVIYSVSGIECYQASNIKTENANIDVSALPDGIYHIAITGNLTGQVYNSRFLKY